VAAGHAGAGGQVGRRGWVEEAHGRAIRV
jgi:hypothetical protein